MRMLRTSLCVLALAGIATPVASLYADTIDLTVIDTGTNASATYSNTGMGSTTASSGGYVTTGNFTYNVSDTGTLGGQAGTTSSTPLSYGVLSVQNTGSISDTVEFIFSANGFGLNTADGNGVLFSQSDGATLSNGSFSMSLQTFADSTNTLYTTAAPAAGGTVAATLISLGSYNNPSSIPNSYSPSPSTTNGTLTAPGNPYSLTSVLQITLAANTSISLTNNGSDSITATTVSTTTPEPAPLAILAAGCLGLAMLSRKNFFRTSIGAK